MVPTQRLYQSRQVGTRWLEQIFRAQDRVQMAATQAEGGVPLVWTRNFVEMDNKVTAAEI